MHVGGWSDVEGYPFGVGEVFGEGTDHVFDSVDVHTPS